MSLTMNSSCWAVTLVTAGQASRVPCVLGLQDLSDELQPEHAGRDHRASELQEKAIQGLRKHSWGCQVCVTQGITSHRAGACSQEGHWDLWAGLRKSLEGSCDGSGDFWCRTLRAALKVSQCFHCLGCKILKSESGSFRKGKIFLQVLPSYFLLLDGLWICNTGICARSDQ